jgi:hypothetical protein
LSQATAAPKTAIAPALLPEFPTLFHQFTQRGPLFRGHDLSHRQHVFKALVCHFPVQGLDGFVLGSQFCLSGLPGHQVMHGFAGCPQLVVQGLHLIPLGFSQSLDLLDLLIGQTNLCQPAFYRGFSSGAGRTVWGFYGSGSLLSPELAGGK